MKLRLLNSELIPITSFHYKIVPEYTGATTWRSHNRTVETIPRFLNSSKKPDITVKRHWSRFKTWLNLTRNIIIDPLLEKQKTATENGEELTEARDRAALITALDAFKWVTGQETERHLIKAYPKRKVHDMNLYEYKTIWP